MEVIKLQWAVPPDLNSLRSKPPHPPQPNTHLGLKQKHSYNVSVFKENKILSPNPQGYPFFAGPTQPFFQEVCVGLVRLQPFSPLLLRAFMDSSTGLTSLPCRKGKVQRALSR